MSLSSIWFSIYTSLVTVSHRSPIVNRQRWATRTSNYLFNFDRMGTVFSREKSQTTERSAVSQSLIKSTVLKSAPSSRLFDTMELEINLDLAACEGLPGISTKSGTRYYWCVELELDIAHTKQVHTLGKIPALLESSKQNLCIPGEAFATAAVNTSVETLSNVSAINVSLRNTVEPFPTEFEKFVIIMHVSQGAYGSVVSRPDDLLRNFYGIAANNDEGSINNDKNVNANGDCSDELPP